MFMSLLYTIGMLIWCLNLFIGGSLVCVKYKDHRRSNDYLHEGNELKKILISTNLQFFLFELIILSFQIYFALSLSLTLNKMEGASMVRIDRKSSIESEPRTLGFDQIQYARVSQFIYLLN